MQKQTVSERYEMTEKMNIHDPPKQQTSHNETSTQEQQTIKLCNQLQQVLLATQQSIQQIQAEYPDNETFYVAQQRMTLANQLLHQLKSSIPETTFPLSQGTRQQVKQLEYQINKASGTLQMIQQSFETTIST